jgi:deoxyribonuclease I
MKTFSLLLFSLLALQSAASTYYPTEYKALLSKKEIKDDALKLKLFKLLVMKHDRRRNGRDDVLVNDCGDAKGSCYGQRSLGYRGARKVLFGKLHLQEDSSGHFINDVYCRKKITNKQAQVGPNIIPSSNVINCEHTWPQSKFSSRFSKGLQKSDLHHLYPTDSRANSVRGNNEFANVNGDALRNCEGSYTGVDKRSGLYFEPPTEHKGNVARALFYFSVRYKIEISSKQESYLRRWHIADPVDAEERDRNDMINKVQGNRNPFIDYPSLVSDIKNF